MNAYTPIVKTVGYHRKVQMLGLCACLLFMVCGALWYPIVTGWFTVPKVAPFVIQPNPEIEKGCRLPAKEAESTLFIVVGNRLRCYKYY